MIQYFKIVKNSYFLFLVVDCWLETILGIMNYK